MHKNKKKFIFNYDEVNFNLANPPKTAVRVKGSKVTKIKCNDNLKENTTYGLIISKGGSFLKPIIIAKGKTKRCLKKYDVTNEIIGTYSNNGWADENCIILMLYHISLITKNEQSALLMDQYGSHMTKKVSDYAKLKNIKLLFIPIGMTDKYQ